ncbi:MAG: FAD-binding protein, partial [Lautropia sp.]
TAAARDGRRAVQWLRREGMHFVRVVQTAQNHVLAPPRPNCPGWNWQGRGPDVLVSGLGTRLVARGGAFARGTRARELIMRNGRCVGLVVSCDGVERQIASRAVMIADGGYQADASLMRRFTSPAPDKLVQRNAGTGRGDGLQMAEAVGARLIGLDSGFYGHLLDRRAGSDPRLNPYPLLDSLGTAGILVTAAGTRVADEGLGGVFLANEVARLPDPMSTFIVFDNGIWNGPGTQKVLPPNPIFVLSGGTVTMSDRIEELAMKAGIDPDGLSRTVDTYNGLVSAGQGDRLSPPRTGTRVKPLLLQPPFGAIAVAPGVTYTMGGIAIDSDARVLDVHDQPIPGLYAAGAATGGLDGGPRSGYVGGLSKAAIFGLRGAEHAWTYVCQSSQRPSCDKEPAFA